MALNEEKILKKGIRKIWFIWGTLLFSLYIYVKICHMIEATWEPILESDFPISILIISLYFISAFLLALSYYFRNYIMRQQSKKEEATYIKRAVKTKSHPAVIKYHVAVISSLAISDCIGILGIVLFLLSKDFQNLYILAIISAIAMLYHRPKMKEFQKIVSTMKYVE